MRDIDDNPPSPLFVGDDLALDFINTEFGVGAAHRECLVDDASVVAWLKLAEVLPEDFALVPEGLLGLALRLRKAAKALVEAAKAGESADAGIVNRVFKASQVSNELRWDEASRSFTVVRQRHQADPASLLEPVAQAVAHLLTHTPLELVRECEAHDCRLMFHDQTKSHRRRWCSMALCGNRMKVAAFRSRKRA